MIGVHHKESKWTTYLDATRKMEEFQFFIGSSFLEVSLPFPSLPPPFHFNNKGFIPPRKQKVILFLKVILKIWKFEIWNYRVHVRDYHTGYTHTVSTRRFYFRNRWHISTLNNTWYRVEMAPSTIINNILSLVVILRLQYTAEGCKIMGIDSGFCEYRYLPETYLKKTTNERSAREVAQTNWNCNDESCMPFCGSFIGSYYPFCAPTPNGMFNHTIRSKDLWVENRIEGSNVHCRRSNLFYWCQQSYPNVSLNSRFS